jgi:hypothetical protein
MPWLIVEVNDRDAARDAKRENIELSDDESERDADWTMPMASFREEESERDAARDAKSANSEVRDEDRDNDTL